MKQQDPFQRVLAPRVDVAGQASAVSLWLLAPIAVVYGSVALVPLGISVGLSVQHGLASFRTVLASPLIVRVAINTLVISATTTVLALILALPVAAALWRSKGRTRLVVLAFVLLPFWTAVLIKNFAWAALLQDNGAVNGVLAAIGLGPITLMHNRIAVVIGMIHFVLPYAIFPIFTAMRGIDLRLESAARSLGAGDMAVIRHVIAPLIMPGLTGAALLVFIVSAGFYITPVILGAPSDMMIANLVDYYVHDLAEFDQAAAVAVLILLAMAPAIALQQTVSRRGQLHAV